MSDRELLELAAKAIGFDLYINMADASQLWKDGEYVRFWKPLHDDGDALRLAVACKLMVDTADHGACTAYYDGGHLMDICYRRAIVRAAAAIALGRAMP